MIKTSQEIADATYKRIQEEIAACAKFTRCRDPKEFFECVLVERANATNQRGSMFEFAKSEKEIE
jgi:hypothetical protein